jgi:hypothetical protein
VSDRPKLQLVCCQAVPAELIAQHRALQDREAQANRQITHSRGGSAPYDGGKRAFETCAAHKSMNPPNFKQVRLIPRDRNPN